MTRKALTISEARAAARSVHAYASRTLERASDLREDDVERAAYVVRAQVEFLLADLDTLNDAIRQIAASS